MPKVSVIIPVYNVEKYLRQCLDSVVNQTLEDIEIICVNDCSPDNSISILNEYASKDNRIRIIDLKENGGLGNARNMAMKEVTSDYMMFLDSDDWLELNACELAYNQITKNGNDFVLFGLYTYNEKKDIKHQNKTKLALFLDYKELSQVTTKDLKGPFFAYAQCWYKIYNTDFLRKNNMFFDSGYYEDQIFNVKLFSLVNNFSVLNVPLYNYRKREGSIVNSMNSWDDCIKKRLNAYEYLKSINSPYISEYILSTVKMLLIFFDRFSVDINQLRKMYRGIYELFSRFNSKFNINYSGEYVDIAHYNLIVKNKSFEKYYIERYVMPNIFSVKNSKDKKHKIITILGFKIKRKQK